MINLLRRDLAPISEEAWQEIDSQARRVLKSLLTARKLVDVKGPYGLDFAGVSTGRLDLVKDKGAGSPGFGVRKLQPLVEVRVPFSLNIWDLDDVSRGARDIDLGPMEEAARSLAGFEEGLLYNGAPEAGIPALPKASTQRSMKIVEQPDAFLSTVAEALAQLQTTPIEGPYALVVGPEMWSFLSSTVQGRPLRHHLTYILDGPVFLSQFVKEPFLVSQRGGDIELVLGQDISIGYEKHDNKTVSLYFAESLTYRIIDPGVVLFFTTG